MDARSIQELVAGKTGEIRLDCDCEGGQQKTLAVNCDTGAYLCHRCGRAGNFKNNVHKSKPEYLLKQASPCTKHPYLDNKGVKAYGGVREDAHGNMVVPLSIDGKLQTLQLIAADGKKIFLKACPKKGSYFQVGDGDGDTINICEGYATAASIYESVGGLVFMAVDAGNLLPAAENLRRTYPDKNFIICADNDRAKDENAKGFDEGYKKACQAALVVDGLVCMPGTAGQDFNDVYVAQGADAVRELIDQAAEPEPEAAEPEPVPALNLIEFLSLEIKQRGYIINPALPEQGLVEIHAPRGNGKTFFLSSIALAVGAGRDFLCWGIPTARRVLYLDGEMPASVMQARLHELQGPYDAIASDYNRFKIITPDLMPDNMSLNLTQPESQQAIEQHVERADLIIIDSLATLCRGGKENLSESWEPMQDYLLRLRRRGKAVIFAHHAGKNGQQRGTSAKEDILDIVIALRRPSDYQENEGARFNVIFEKARGVCGKAVDPFECQLKSDAQGGLVWTYRPLDDVRLMQAEEMAADGMTVREIADELGISKSQAHRLLKKVQQ